MNTFFHATFKTRGKMAKKRGLKPRAKTRIGETCQTPSNGDFVYLFSNQGRAEGFAKALNDLMTGVIYDPETIVLKIELPKEIESKLEPDPFFDDPYAFVYEGSIPAACIIETIPV